MVGMVSMVSMDSMDSTVGMDSVVSMDSMVSVDSMVSIDSMVSMDCMISMVIMDSMVSKDIMVSMDSMVTMDNMVSMLSSLEYENLKYLVTTRGPRAVNRNIVCRHVFSRSVKSQNFTDSSYVKASQTICSFLIMQCATVENWHRIVRVMRVQGCAQKTWPAFC